MIPFMLVDAYKIEEEGERLEKGAPPEDLSKLEEQLEHLGGERVAGEEPKGHVVEGTVSSVHLLRREPSQ